MSERKVLNKYYPPDFDPTKLPKLKRERNRQFVIRIMAPFSMRCTTCGEYIYKGRKFNSRMETVENETYLGLRIYRFYIRCTKCISEITFKTDPENTDYRMEHGATRNFEAYKKLEERVEREKKDREEEEANNPMKALENRTRDSKREMESLEKLEELRDLNQRIAGIDHDKLIGDHLKVIHDTLKKQEEDDEREDEQLIKKIFGTSSSSGYVKRIIDNDSDDSDNEKETVHKTYEKKPTASDYLIDTTAPGILPGPSKPPPKKSKLKTPFDDISSMVRLKKPKLEKPKIENSVDRHKDTNNTVKTVQHEPEVALLPTYKINLKKVEDKNCNKLKGTSLNLLGGYNSSDSETSSGNE